MTLVFIDTETTSLRPDRRAWDIALIVRTTDGDVEHQWFIEARDLDLGNADPFALRIGHFYERHPEYNGELDNEPAWGRIHCEEHVLREIEALTRGAILHGSNPAFDAETLGARMRAHGICPSWHYHPEDVPTLAKGWLLGAGKPLPESIKSDAISLAVGVDPAGCDRHTAIGDARWARDMYDAVMGTKPVEPLPEWERDLLDWQSAAERAEVTDGN